MAHGALTRAEVRKALKKLRSLGIKPPKVGHCVTVAAGERVSTDYYGERSRVELCRHPRSRYIPNDTGYQVVTQRRAHGLFGARKRKSLRQRMKDAGWFKKRRVRKRRRR